MNALNDFIRNARILIVDDELANVRLIEANLEYEGQRNFRGVLDSRQAVSAFREFRPDIVLLDLLMPHVSGFEVLEQLKDLIAPDQNLPIVILTADVSQVTRRRALAAGARDFLTKPFDETELHLRLRNLLELRFLHLGLRRQNEDLEARVQQRTHDLQQALVDLKTAQRQAIRQERLHAFAQMASGVVHDFNNTLSVLVGYTELLLADSLEDKAETRDCLNVMHTAARDATAVVDRLRHFYRPHQEDDRMATVNLAELLHQAVQLSKPRWKEQAQAQGRAILLTLESDKNIQLWCNPSELREVFINLIFNAVDAMPDGGSISIRATHRDGNAIIESSDTGMGMTEEVQQKCLEPFFTTKGSKGTGLGLAIAAGIVRRHGGTIEVRSSPGHGATFLISMPIQEPPPKALYDGTAQGQSLRILFADDDADVVNFALHQLKEAGHEPTGAANGLEAFSKFASERFDMVITDLSMPKMNGAKLAEAIKRCAPRIPVLMLTGFGSMLLTDGQKPPGVDAILSKPVTCQELLNAVNALPLADAYYETEAFPIL